MLIVLQKAFYDGADGTSITEDRCEKYLALLKMTEQMGEIECNYKEIQKYATDINLFPETNNIPSAVRTIVPLLMKFGFIIDYDRKTFLANTFFTKAGKMFVYILDAIKKNNDRMMPDSVLAQCLNRAKTLTLQLGLINMASSFPENKIWILLYLIKRIGYVNSDIFYYTLSCLQDEKTVDDAIDSINNDISVTKNDYVKEDKTSMEPNPFTYRVNVLRDMGLVEQKADRNYYFTEDSDNFLNQLSEKVNPELKNQLYISLLL